MLIKSSSSVNYSYYLRAAAAAVSSSPLKEPKDAKHAGRRSSVIAANNSTSQFHYVFKTLSDNHRLR